MTIQSSVITLPDSLRLGQDIYTITAPNLMVYAFLLRVTLMTS